jgi:hypothetical protein
MLDNSLTTPEYDRSPSIVAMFNGLIELHVHEQTLAISKSSNGISHSRGTPLWTP